MQTVFSNEKEFNEFKVWTYGLLKDKNVKDLRITFTKKDGTERKMLCTLVSAKIPTDKQPHASVGLEEETTRQIDGSAVRVFDTEKQEWRSFRWDAVKVVEFDL